MSAVIRGGGIVAHDLTYAADVLVEGGIVTAIVPDLAGDTVVEATGCLVVATDRGLREIDVLARS